MAHRLHSTAAMVSGSRILFLILMICVALPASTEARPLPSLFKLGAKQRARNPRVVLRHWSGSQEIEFMPFDGPRVKTNGWFSPSHVSIHGQDGVSVEVQGWYYGLKLSFDRITDDGRPTGVVNLEHTEAAIARDLPWALFDAARASGHLTLDEAADVFDATPRTSFLDGHRVGDVQFSGALRTDGAIGYDVTLHRAVHAGEGIQLPTGLYIVNESSHDSRQPSLL